LGSVDVLERRALRAPVKTNLRVRNCRICHLKPLDRLGLLIVFFLRRHSSLQFNHGGIGMNNKILRCLAAGALSAALALASPALARGGGGGGGGGGHGGGGMGGGHGGMGMGGGHGGMGGMGMGGGMHAGGWGGGAHFGGMNGGAHFSGGHFAGARFAHAGFSPRFSSFGFRGHARFFHHRFHRFAFVGGPILYASYDSCWRRVWTPYGPQWADVCGDYGY
jgi:hypothetical protein